MSRPVRAPRGARRAPPVARRDIRRSFGRAAAPRAAPGLRAAFRCFRDALDADDISFSPPPCRHDIFAAAMLTMRACATIFALLLRKKRRRHAPYAADAPPPCAAMSMSTCAISIFALCAPLDAARWRAAMPCHALLRYFADASRSFYMLLLRAFAYAALLRCFYFAFSLLFDDIFAPPCFFFDVAIRRFSSAPALMAACSPDGFSSMLIYKRFSPFFFALDFDLSFAPPSSFSCSIKISRAKSL